MSFRQARLKSGHTPPTRELPVAAGAAFRQGALLVRDANGAWAECGADPAAVGAIALSDYGAADATAIGVGHGRHEFPPGHMQGMKVQDEQEFHAEYVGTLPAADGGTYGVTRGGDSKWRVDFAKDGAAARVKLVKRLTEAPINRNRVVVSFLPANVQIV
jgi:hypothetical protein